MKNKFLKRNISFIQYKQHTHSNSNMDKQKTRTACVWWVVGSGDVTVQNPHYEAGDLAQ